MRSPATANDPSAAVARRATGTEAAWIFLRPTPHAALARTGYAGPAAGEGAPATGEPAAKAIAAQAVRAGRPVISPDFIAVALEVDSLDGAIVVAQCPERTEEMVLESLCAVARDFVGLRLHDPAAGPRRRIAGSRSAPTREQPANASA